MSRALRVLFILPRGATDSSMIFVRRQAVALGKEGVQVELFELRSRTSLPELVSEFRRYRAQLHRSHPDVVHAHFGTMTGLFAALGCGHRPLVVTYWGSDLNPPQKSAGVRERVRSGIGRVLSQLTALRAARTVCVSWELASRLWWRRGNVSVMPGGVDTAVFFPETRESARARLNARTGHDEIQHGWSQADRVILFNAGHDPGIKRLDLAKEAVAEALRKLSGVRMEVMAGRVDPLTVPTLMNAADCLLVTSDSEGSPTVVQEAIACGLPVVSVPAGDVAERLEGVYPSSIVARDAHALGDALVQVLKRGERSNGSHKTHEFSTATIARRLRDIYSEVLGDSLAAEPSSPDSETAWNISRFSPSSRR